MSLRADVLIRRTYNRPLNTEGTKFETWEQTVERVTQHQRWLWERAKTHLVTGLHYSDIKEDNPNWIKLNESEEVELSELRQMILDKKIAVAGRTLWLGGTKIAKEISISQFNCAAIKSSTVYDIVDHFWALLNGSGMGFMPVPGTLTGFKHAIPKVTIISSIRTSTEKGRETNKEDFTNGIWTIQIGDSAIAWAKSIGKLLAGKYKAKELVLDFSEIRGGGARLSNYGWISQGSKGLESAYTKIVNILNKKADNLLSTLDLLDIDNLLGTVLSTRRSAQIGLLNYSSLDWKDFATAKNNMYSEDGSVTGLEHRSQSNNSIIFDVKPSKEELKNLLYMMHRGGKGEPGIVNGKTLKERAPWASLLNP